MKDSSVVSVILVQYNNAGLTKKAIESFAKTVSAPHEIIVVDNGSDEPDATDIFRGMNNVHLIASGENLGFGRANNLAVQHSRGDILLFLNNDTVTTMDFVSPILEEFQGNPSLGAAGPRLLNTDGSFQLSGGDLPTFLVEVRDKVLYGMVDRKMAPAVRYAERRSVRKQNVEWVTGAALFVRAELFRRLVGFDERFFMFFEDKDLCLRIRDAGYFIRTVPEVSLVHLRGGSGTGISERIQSIYRKSQRAYYDKHRTRLERFLLEVYLSLTGKGNPA